MSAYGKAHKGTAGVIDRVLLAGGTPQEAAVVLAAAKSAAAAGKLRGGEQEFLLALRRDSGRGGARTFGLAAMRRRVAAHLRHLSDVHGVHVPDDGLDREGRRTLRRALGK